MMLHKWDRHTASCRLLCILTRHLECTKEQSGEARTEDSTIRHLPQTEFVPTIESDWPVSDISADETSKVIQLGYNWQQFFRKC